MSKFDDLIVDKSKMLEVMIPYFMKSKERIEVFNFYGLSDTPIRQFQNLIANTANQKNQDGRLYRRILKNDPVCKVKFTEKDTWTDYLLSDLMLME